MFIFDHIWLLALSSSSVVFSFALIFCSLSSPNIPMQDSGGARHLREGNLWFYCTSLLLGTCLYQTEYSVLTLYMSSQSWYSCDFFCLLWLVDVSVLSNLVYSGPFPSKPTQDHKVSICITVMCIRNSCWCTYCLQEGLMSMKVHFLYSYLLPWCI